MPIWEKLLMDNWLAFFFLSYKSKQTNKTNIAKLIFLECIWNKRVCTNATKRILDKKRKNFSFFSPYTIAQNSFFYSLKSVTFNLYCLIQNASTKSRVHFSFQPTKILWVNLLTKTRSDEKRRQYQEPRP